jgi:hypothetical protein
MHPGLKDRLQALGAFTGIALGAVAGVEMVIGAGFDPLMPGDELREVAPSAYVQVADTFWDGARVIPLSSTEPYFMGDDYLEVASASDSLLDGGVDDASAPDGGYPDDDYYLSADAPDLDALQAEIERLYAETADFARDVEYDSSWRSGQGERFVDQMNVAEKMGEHGYSAGGYADAQANLETEEPVLRGAPTPEDLQAIEPSASESASPS